MFRWCWRRRLSVPMSVKLIIKDVMHISDEGAEALERHEGFRSHRYRDAKGVWTIGIGETLGVNENTPDVTYEEAKAQFKRRLERDFEPAVNAAIGDAPTTQKQFDAIMSFAYNCKGWETSSVIKFHKAGKYDAAASAFLWWNKVSSDGINPIGGIVYPKGTLRILDGLTSRRSDEARVYRDGNPKNGAEGGNENDAIERSAQPSPESDKPLSQSRTVAGGTIASIASGVGIYAQVSASIKEAATNTMGAVKEFGDPLIVLSIGGAVATLAAVGYMLYARWDDRQKGLR
jgi:GH24 family phage-related lysozyme (muramidase)